MSVFEYESCGFAAAGGEIAGCVHLLHMRGEAPRAAGVVFRDGEVEEIGEGDISPTDEGWRVELPGGVEVLLEPLENGDGPLRACRATGAVDGLGEHVGPTPFDGEIARCVGAWLGDDAAITLTAVRGAGEKGHEDEAIAARLHGSGPVDDARLSTRYDGQGRPRGAGLELWETPESEFPRRAAGTVIATATADLGGFELSCSLVAWRMEGRAGLGRYDILRRA